MNSTYTIYLGLGTNTGNREENLTAAIAELSQLSGSCISKSAFVETEPWGFESSNRFLNCTVAFETDIPPLELLDMTESIERKLGRTLKSANGVYHDRIIDIDILLYGNMVINSERLTIPHPLMHKRDFVLFPLCEIAAEVKHPVLNKTIFELAAALKESNRNSQNIL